MSLGDTLRRVWSRNPLVRMVLDARRQERLRVQTANALAQMAAHEYVHKHLMSNPKYDDAKRLNRHGFQVFSQGGEDGIIAEIFRRIGATGDYFVEFGVGGGLTCNTTYLLAQGKSGLWLEASVGAVARIQSEFKQVISNGALMVRQASVTAENIELLLQESGVPREFDLLSIDIDGNDYWVWRAIENFNPRLVVIEYNAVFPPGTRWVREYDPSAIWNGTSYFGASLESLAALGEAKGYRLVGCTFTGVNAFFVREDLVGSGFCEPFSSENHYEPPRYFLARRAGHASGFGAFVIV